MKAKIEINFDIDGTNPGKEKLIASAWSMLSENGYVGSESIDGTDNWGLEIGQITVEVEE